MEKMWERVVKGLAVVGGVIAGAFGGLPVLIRVLAGVMVIDYSTGCLAAWMGKSRKTEGGGISSKAGFIGLAKKATILLVVLLATILDGALNAQIFQMAAAGFYVANEGISVLENVALLGVPVPAVIREKLEQLKEEKHPKSIE
ncbi:MAG: phage holin family protein [Clostridia bacterium]